MPSFVRLVALLVAAAACVAAQSSDLSPQAKCLGDCFASVLEKTPSPQGCGSVTTAKDIEDCLCKSTDFASDVGACIGTTCPDFVRDIAQNVGSFCEANTPASSSSGSSGNKPSSSTGGDSGLGVLGGKGAATALQAPVVGLMGVVGLALWGM
ncbi:hypothetical protein AURDEDRAFT_117343 [Auricularia subglabra TFB-10046 SS5]|nr:hypothetical protein AURDEDRAFT_117343 [Auricularia subglabra TFB-10046 SS5]